MIPLKHIRQTTLDLVQAHHDRDGLGSDPYHSAKIQHAMAEGKLLAVLAELRQSEVVTASYSDRIAAASIRRLRGLSIATEFGPAFGLGFPWKGMPADAPMTITTAVVIHGLERFGSVTRHHAQFESLAQEARKWLVSPHVLDPEVGLPYFSPNYPIIVTNVVAYWSHVLRKSHPNLSEAGIRHVRQSYLPGAGWPYAPGSTRLDLLHTCYTALPLLSSHDFTVQIAAAVSRFITPTSLLDRVDCVSHEEASATAMRSSHACITIEAKHGYVLHKGPARSWSVGELLSVCAAQPGGSEFAGFWKNLSIRAVEELENVNFAADGPRHTMHVAHGLAAHLAWKRRG